MANYRKLKISPTKPDGALVVFSIQGRIWNFPDGKPVTVEIAQDACYEVMLVCRGNMGDKASVEFSAVNKEMGVYICTPSDDPTWDEYKKLEVTVPSGESAWINLSKIAIRGKSERPED